jgi:hypothetical protein
MRQPRTIVSRRLAPSLLLLGSVAACTTQRSNPPQAATHARDTTPAPTTTAQQSIDACALLTPDEAQAILGEPVGPPERNTLGGTVTCEYRTTKIHGGISPYWVHIAVSPESQQVWDAGKTLHKTELRPVSGVGDDAYYLLDDLVIHVKQESVDIGVLKSIDTPTHKKDIESAEIAAAQKVVGRV